MLRRPTARTERTRCKHAGSSMQHPSSSPAALDPKIPSPDHPPNQPTSKSMYAFHRVSGMSSTGWRMASSNTALDRSVSPTDPSSAANCAHTPQSLGNASRHLLEDRGRKERGKKRANSSLRRNTYVPVLTGGLTQVWRGRREEERCTHEDRYLDNKKEGRGDECFAMLHTYMPDFPPKKQGSTQKIYANTGVCKTHVEVNGKEHRRALAAQTKRKHTALACKPYDSGRSLPDPSPAARTP